MPEEDKEWRLCTYRAACLVTGYYTMFVVSSLHLLNGGLQLSGVTEKRTRDAGAIRTLVSGAIMIPMGATIIIGTYKKHAPTLKLSACAFLILQLFSIAALCAIFVLQRSFDLTALLLDVALLYIVALFSVALRAYACEIEQNREEENIEMET
ncbi:hypothetical protein J6590_061823 [Homalodisca vitripennis]|nr:hypothetical protein J6590_061823 [Homalodisca vitripennis]